MNPVPAENTLARVKDEIRAQAELARRRAGELKIDKPELPASPAQELAARSNSYSIDELCRSNFTTFLDNAYDCLLRRKPDSAGYDAQLQQLASGRSKIEVLGNLRWSAEGRDIGVRVPFLLPRYLLAKLTRIPVFGYLIEWLFGLCSLPRLIRHQRATDVYNSARRHEIRHQLLTLAEQIQAIHVELGRLDKLETRDLESSSRLNQLIDHVPPLEANMQRLEENTQRLESGLMRSDVQSNELRHTVLSMNHWMASLRNNLSALESAEQEQQRKSEALSVDVALRVLSSDKHRQASMGALSAHLMANLPASANVLDLCSGEDWLQRLLESGFEASGVACGSEAGKQASSERRNIIHAGPAAMLARTADHSLQALTSLDPGSLLRQIPAAKLLSEARRVLRKEGWIMFGFSSGPATIADRLDGKSDSDVDGTLMVQILLAAGFVEVEQFRSAEGAICVLGRNEG